MTRSRPGRPACRTLVGLCLAAVLAPRAATAELVVLTDGNFLKVSSYELVEADRMRLELELGGGITMALGRIERIVEDEVEPRAAAAGGEAVAALPEPPPAAAPFPWRFDPSHPVPAVSYGELIYDAARKHGVNPALVAAVVRAESAFDRYALSSKGARGLMQLMPATARRFGVRSFELYRPRPNLEAGVTYLRWLLERYDSDLEKALAGYNAGEGTVDRYAGVPPFRETRGYIRRVYATLGLSEPSFAAR